MHFGYVEHCQYEAFFHLDSNLFSVCLEESIQRSIQPKLALITQLNEHMLHGLAGSVLKSLPCCGHVFWGKKSTLFVKSEALLTW